MKHRVLSLVLVLCMVVAMLPTALAAESISIAADVVVDVETDTTYADELEESFSADSTSETAEETADTSDNEADETVQPAAEDNSEIKLLDVLTETVSGTCGTSATWTLTTDGVLTISGTGAIDNYKANDTNRPPWYGYESGIYHVVIEDGITTIGDYAFAYHSSLQTITVPASVTSFKVGCFVRCDPLSEFCYEGDLAGWCAMSFSSTPFSNTNVLLKIGGEPVTDLVIPSSITKIGSYPFNGYHKLTSLDYNASTIANEMFMRCPNLTSVTLGDNVKSTGKSAFEGCEKLGEINFGSGLETIGARTFYGCTAIEEITIPDSVTTMGDNVFYNCTGLQRASLPDSVTSIGHNTFNGCTALTDVRLSNQIPEINGMFYECSSLQSVTIPDSVTVITNGAFSGCSELTTVKLSKNLTEISSYAFSGCSKLKHITLPESLITIGSISFKNCTSLETITIPANVSNISESFETCTALRRIDVSPENENYCSIDGVLFNGDATELIRYPVNKGGVSYAVPDGVTTIGHSSFYKVVRLASVTFPASLESVGTHAFYGSTLTSAVFRGDAPSVYIATQSWNYSFEKNTTTLYYDPSTAGWTTPMWNGYYTTPVFGLAAAGFHDGNYYPRLSDHYFYFYDEAGAQLTNVSIDLGNGNSMVCTGPSVEINMIDTASDQVLTFSKDGYHAVEVPLYVLSAFNRITLYPTSYDKPFVKAAYASQDGGETYHNLMHSGMNFNAGSLTEETVFYIDADWYDAETGDIYLTQVYDVNEDLRLTEGQNEPKNVSLHLKANGNLYMLLRMPDGEVHLHQLAATVISEGDEYDLDLGEDIEIPESASMDVEFLSKFDFGMKLNEKANVKFSIMPDGTLMGVIGMELPGKEEEVRTTVDSIKDALLQSEANKDAKNAKDLDNFLKKLKGDDVDVAAPVKNSTFVVEAESQLLGYVIGKLIQEENGSYGVQFTEFKVGLLIKGNIEKTWQMYAGTTPFYVGGALEPSAEATLTLYSTDEEDNKLAVAPLDLEAKIMLKARGGLGWDSIASAGIYGQGTGAVQHRLPGTKDDLKIVFNAAIGAEAEFFCFNTDLEIIKTKDFYLVGAPEAELFSLFDTSKLVSSLNWVPQSREYLYTPALFSVTETETTGETVVSNVYPYTNVQLAALADGTQIMVWTADPGTRAADNNRTILFYTYYDGEAWSTPAPVQALDDETGDFNPVLKVLDDTAYLSWQNASRPLTAEDTVVTTAAVMDVTVAKFEPDTGFETLGTIGTEYYDGAVSLTLMDGDLAIAWASNTAENPLAANGQTAAIHRAVWNGEAFDRVCLATGLGAVDKTTANNHDVWFSADTDYDSATLNDREIFHYNNTLTQITDNDIPDTQPVHNESLLWYANGKIVSSAGAAIALDADTDRYQYVQNGAGLEAVVYVVTDDARVSSLYASFNDGSGWGAPILLDGGSNHIGNFSASFRADGALVVAARERGITDTTELTLSDVSVLKLYTITPVTEIAVEAVDYIAHSLVSAGTLDVQLDLVNNGMSTVDLVEVTVLDGTTVLSKNMVATTLHSGERETFFTTAALPAAVPEELTVRVTPVGATDSDETNNEATLALRLQDISLESAVAVSDASSTTVTVLAANRGQSTLSGILLTLEDEDGNALDTAETAALAAGESAFITFTLDSAYANNTVMKVTASGLEEENLTANNSVYALVSAPKAKAVRLAVNAYAASDGSVQIMAEIRNTTDAQQTYTLLCAEYNADGKMLSVQLLEDLTILSGEKQIQDFTFQSSAAYVKLFALSNDGSVLAPSVRADVY